MTGLKAGAVAFESKTAVYGGGGFLVVASVWNAWPKGRQHVGPCPTCAHPAVAKHSESAP